MSLDLGPALRTALIGNLAIAARLAQWRAEPCVFAYRPVPADAPMPLAIINPNSALTDADGLMSDRPVLARDIAVYGRRGTPGESSDQSAAVDEIAYLIRQLFHRQKFSVTVAGFSVIDIIASGPIPAPADDDGEIGRLVALTIRLRRNSA